MGPGHCGPLGSLPRPHPLDASSSFLVWVIPKHPRHWQMLVVKQGCPGKMDYREPSSKRVSYFPFFSLHASQFSNGQNLGRRLCVTAVLSPLVPKDCRPALHLPGTMGAVRGQSSVALSKETTSADLMTVLLN